MVTVVRTSRFSWSGLPRSAAVVALVAGAAVLSGCASQSASSNVYTYQQAQREQVTYMGTVLGVRNITIQSDHSSGIGTVAGAVLGGVLGSTIGGGSGRVIATAAGAAAGGLVGNTVENNTGRKAGYEITLRLDNGETRVVAQEADVPISVGQRVQVITGSGATRVVPVR